ncbi:MAG: hypothetical protein PHO77_05250 [Bacteroidales bacterium]|nr:hypothetical protein [Bacteroidales bacterium]
MKKCLVTTTVLMVFAVFFTACDKDGIYNPKEKIKTISYSTGDTKVLQETWTWDKNLLTKITYNSEDGDYTTFEYDKKQVSKIIEYSEGVEDGYMLFTYDKALLQKMEMFYDGNLTMKAEVTHDKKKITKITITEVDLEEFATTKSLDYKQFLTRMMRFVVGKESAKIITQHLLLKSDNSYSIEFIYEGDNVKTEKLTALGVNIYTIAYTYDDKMNPFCDALYYGESGAISMSKNNVLTAKQTSAMEEASMETEYTYVYDGKWPTEQKTTFSYYGQTFSETYYYEYLD